ncbi:MAG TPA: acetyl-CoA carboxylase biotin carboxyl carrier protein [Gemmatimonadaceae bacterium]|nr:acetyl-CoA carboxylase biotin carboxyl carrier protein [Gemmatimonadaceae bacterium]
MIDLRYVKKLVDMLDQSSVDTIEIMSDKGVKLKISKRSGRAQAQMLPPMVMPAQPLPAAMPMATPANGVPITSDAAPAPPLAPEARSYLEVKSPMVGTFYSSPEPGKPPYVTEGQRIEKGQILCIIEAMKIMNEIESEFSGVIKSVAADDAHAVEYGQVLFRIDPNG